MHDGTRTCSPYNDGNIKGLLPCDLFFEEDEYEYEDKYGLDHDTSDEDSLMSDKDVDKDSWTFIENPIYDMSEEENNEPNFFDGFVDSLVYDISNGGGFDSLDGFTEYHICEVLKGEIMDLLALGNFLYRRGACS